MGKPDFSYPYEPTDARREDLEAPDEVLRVLRGGSFSYVVYSLRAALRYGYSPDYRDFDISFRVVSSRSSPLIL